MAFNQSLLILKLLNPNESPFETSLNTSKFWVQVHKLLASFFTENVAKAIGTTLGKFIRTDKKNFEGTWKSFMRVHVLLDITKPLRRKMNLKKIGRRLDVGGLQI